MLVKSVGVERGGGECPKASHWKACANFCADSSHGRFRLLALHHSICLRLRDILISHLLSTSQSQHSTSTDSKLTKQHKSFRYQNTNMSPSKSSTASSVPSSSQLKVVDKNQEVPIFLRSKYSTVPNQCRSD